MGLTVIEIGHYYPDNNKTYQVSVEAKQDMKNNWVEFPGLGAGEAVVTHPDWFQLYQEMQVDCPKIGNWIISYAVFAKTPDGKTAHIGILSYYPEGFHGKGTPAKIKLEG